jgi:hypothetical protein
MAMLGLRNYIDRSSLTITASPTALAELPTSNLKVPWFDGIARGSSVGRTVSLSWELPASASEPEPRVDLVALLGLNWRSSFLATLKWWNFGGSWSSPLGSTSQLHYYMGSYVPWIGLVPRNVFVPIPTSVTEVQYWRLDVTYSVSPEDSYAWEARRLWAGPALRFSMRAEPETEWSGTHVVATGETGIPNVSSGRTFRRLGFEGRSISVRDVYGVENWMHDLNQLLFDRGPYTEAILLPRDVSDGYTPNLVQTLGAYGHLLPGLRTRLMRGNRVDLSGQLQEVPHPLPSPLAAPT